MTNEPTRPPPGASGVSRPPPREVHVTAKSDSLALRNATALNELRSIVSDLTDVVQDLVAASDRSDATYTLRRLQHELWALEIHVAD